MYDVVFGLAVVRITKWVNKKKKKEEVTVKNAFGSSLNFVVEQDTWDARREMLH